ncbi:hypothetical protein VSAK1_24920 [Vibrio mediterranei AK1]|uniref:hypothetical protein n=1 Tax=Vibrio mediterranei TaxID=689 RepID=UPI000154009F|nr:hypothetical protein [Vibrio mediterranei]EDL54335.1 hypothetical protein VSAK1_24920 [Vibrio mediterranei AK1]
MIEIHWSVALAMSFCSFLGILRVHGRRVDRFMKRVSAQMLKILNGSMKASNYAQQRTETELYQIGSQERKYEFGDYIRQQTTRNKDL